MNLPRLVIAGTQSGVGKTSLTLGLVAALAKRGLRVQTFKTGPDYLDPTYLALASGRPCYNLDGWMSGAAYLKALFARAAAQADIALIEGAMGLFDGAASTGLEGSTAEIARLLGAPVILVADAHGAGRSFAAMVHGFASFEPGVRVSGVIANRTGSARHAAGLRESLAAAGLPPLLGAVQRNTLPELPSRHLGLVTATADQLQEVTLNQLAQTTKESVDLDALLAAARRVPALGEIQDHPQSSPRIARLGIARDEAFHFYYPDNLEALERAGCELVPFSPLRDNRLPPALDGLYLGGGYPEEHAARLSANRSMLEALRQFAAARRVVYAECGGLMYLAQGIEERDGARHEMAGLLPAWTRMTGRRAALGYVEAELTHDTLWGRAGDRLRGHEFHYSRLESPPEGAETAYLLHYRRTGETVPEGYRRGSVFASYVHLHFASRPEAVARFVEQLRAPLPAPPP